jgi:ubiquinone/menaquinone biosynthesis C-methylase UbiE
MRYDKDIEEFRTIFNRYGENYTKGKERDLNRKQLSRIILSMLGEVKNKRILDAGCGSGKECEMLAKRGARVVGIDISKRMITLAKERCKGLGVEFFVRDMGRTGFKGKSFDIIIAIFSIMFKRKIEELFKEFRRILKEKGILLIVVPHPIREMMKYTKNYFKKGKYWKVLHDMKVFSYSWTVGDYINDLISQGFELKEVREPRPKFGSPEEKSYPIYLILKLKLRTKEFHEQSTIVESA